MHGEPLAFSGLRLRPLDLNKIGRLLLDKGQWQGRQIVPAQWVEGSMQAHTATGDDLDYGYQWWLGYADVLGKQVNQTEHGLSINQLFKRLLAGVRTQ